MILTRGYIEDIQAVLEVPGIESLRGARIIVTGATGLIGSSLVDVLLWLNQECRYGIDVIAAGRDESAVSSRFSWWVNKPQYMIFDLNKAFCFEGEVDFIVHCAGIAHPAMYAMHPVETMLSGVMGTESLLRWSAYTEIKRFLYLSSSEVYGVGVGSDPLFETDYGVIDCLDSRSCYPNSKRFCESLCSAFHSEMGLEFAIARPGHVYGPTITASDSRAHAQFARSAARGENIVMKSDGLQERSYCYVTDCVTAMLTILLAGESNQAYNIAFEGCRATVGELAQAFSQAGGVELVVDAPNELERIGYNRMSNSVLNGSKLEALGWSGKKGIGLGAMRTVEMLRINA